MNYYIMKDNIQQGPFSEEDMETLYFARKLPVATPVWYEGAENWGAFSTTPIYETYKNNYRKSLFLLTLPLVLFPVINDIIIWSLILIPLGGWMEIILTIKRFKYSDCKKYDLGLIICGLYPAPWTLLGLGLIFVDISSHYMSIIVIIQKVLFYGIWIGFILYSGIEKSIIAAGKKVFFAHKKACVMLKKQ